MPRSLHLAAGRPTAFVPGWALSAANLLGAPGAAAAVKVRLAGGSVKAALARGLRPVAFRYEWCDAAGRPLPDGAGRAIARPDGLPGTRHFTLALTLPDSPGAGVLTLSAERCPEPPRRVPYRVVPDFADDIDYNVVYALADLTKDPHTVVGPSSEAESAGLAEAKWCMLRDHGLTPRHRLLDVGCGTGQVPSKLRNFFSPPGGYTGTEIAPQAVDYCRRQFAEPGFEFHLAEPTVLPLPAASHDAACLFSVLTHTYPDETVLLLSEVRRCLKPGGFVLADAFVSPTVTRFAGHRGRMVHEEKMFLRFVPLAGFAGCAVSHEYVEPDARRVFYRLTA